MAEVRERTLGLVSHLDETQLTTVIDPIMSPLAWDLGHVAAYEDLWLNHRVGGHALLRPGLAELYDAFETPRAVRGDLEFLRGEELLAYMAEVRERAGELAPHEYHELVIRHELQHTETMLQAMVLGGIAPASLTGPQPVPGTVLEFVQVRGGRAEIGAPAEGFAYDNERPRHSVDVPAF